MLPVGQGVAQGLRLVDGVLVERKRGGQADPAVVPGRLRVVLGGPKSSHCVAEMTVGTSLSPEVRWTSSPREPRSEYATSTSPFSMARRVMSSVTTRHTMRFTAGVFRQ